MTSVGAFYVDYSKAMADPAVKFFQRDWSPATAAVLKAAFEGEHDVVPHDLLHRRVLQSFDRLAEGADLRHIVPRDIDGVRQRINDWTRDRYLFREISAETGAVEYRLTSQASAAIGYLDEILQAQRTDRALVTGQKTAHLLELVERLALATAPTQEALRERLEARRASLVDELSDVDRQLAALSRGEEIERPDTQTIVEIFRYFNDEVDRALLTMKAAEYQYQDLAEGLRRQFAEEGQPHSEIIGGYLDRVERLEEEPAGRGFAEAYSVLTSQNRAEFEGHIRTAARHPGIEGLLQPGEQARLRSTAKRLWDSVVGVNSRRRAVTRRLQTYLRTHDPSSERQVAQLLNESGEALIRLGHARGARSAVDLPLAPLDPEANGWLSRLDAPALRLGLEQPRAAGVPPLAPAASEAPASDPGEALRTLLARGGPHERAILARIDALFEETQADELTGEQIFAALADEDRRLPDLVGLLRLVATAAGSGEAGSVEESQTAVYEVRTGLTGRRIDFEGPRMTMARSQGAPEQTDDAKGER